MAKWIQTSLEEKGIKIEDGAVTELVSRVGGSLAQTEKELEKLSSYSASITVEDVQNMSQDRSTHKTFELASLVTRGDVKNALYVLHKLIDQGESIQLILASLAWQMRKLVELSRRIEEGGNPFQSATSLGIKFNAYEFINALKGTSSRKLEEKHSLILEADLALKSTQLNEAAVVDTLIVKLCKR
jgi:DNA polymerase III delta subunit